MVKTLFVFIMNKNLPTTNDKANPNKLDSLFPISVTITPHKRPPIGNPI